MRNWKIGMTGLTNLKKGLRNLKQNLIPPISVRLWFWILILGVIALGIVADCAAENIEDLQLTYKLMNGTITDVPPLSRNIREVRITLAARTHEADPDFPGDPYRQRIYTSKVNLRNLDL